MHYQVVHILAGLCLLSAGGFTYQAFQLVDRGAYSAAFTAVACLGGAVVLELLNALVYSITKLIN